MVKDLLERLEAVQAVDQRVREHVKARDAIPARISELLAETRQKEAELAAISARIADQEKERRALEGNAQDYAAKLAKIQAQQASVTNQKEYEAYLREADALKKHKNHFEEEVLRSMEMLETHLKTRAAATEAVAQSREAVQGEVVALEARIAELDAAIAEEEGARTSLIANIPKNMLRVYDQIRSRRGRAVVGVTGGVCAGCNMNLPPQLYNVIQRLTSVEQCPGCQRFLFYRTTEAEPRAS